MKLDDSVLVRLSAVILFTKANSARSVQPNMGVKYDAITIHREGHSIGKLNVRTLFYALKFNYVYDRDACGMK